MLNEWMMRLRAWRHGEEIHSEIAEEREFHIAMSAADLVRGGMSAAAANEAARRKFGAVMRLQEKGFDVRGGGLLEEISGDIVLAMRLLRKSPARTIALVAT